MIMRGRTSTLSFSVISCLIIGQVVSQDSTTGSPAAVSTPLKDESPTTPIPAAIAPLGNDTDGVASTRGFFNPAGNGFGHNQQHNPHFTFNQGGSPHQGQNGQFGHQQGFGFNNNPHHNQGNIGQFGHQNQFGHNAGQHHGVDPFSNEVFGHHGTQGGPHQNNPHGHGHVISQEFFGGAHGGHQSSPHVNGFNGGNQGIHSGGQQFGHQGAGFSQGHVGSGHNFAANQHHNGQFGVNGHNNFGSQQFPGQGHNLGGHNGAGFGGVGSQFQSHEVGFNGGFGTGHHQQPGHFQPHLNTGGQPHLNAGGQPHSGHNNLNQAPPSKCRFWCKTPQGQAYCCENAAQAETPVFTKPGLCPPSRATCPRGSLGPPKTCSNDGACSGHDKCCFDTCLQEHVCKPIQGVGR